MKLDVPFADPLSINKLNVAASHLCWQVAGGLLGAALFLTYTILDAKGRATIISVINTVANPNKIYLLLMVSMLGLSLHTIIYSITSSHSAPPLPQCLVVKPASIAYKVISAIAGGSIVLAIFSFTFWEAHYLGAASITAFIVCSIGALSIPAMFKTSRLAADKNPKRASLAYSFLSVLIMISMYTELHSTLIG